MLLQDLYQEIMLDHGRSPRNFGLLTEATYTQSGHNPLCGDQLELYVSASDKIVTDLRFSGQGCTISIASASLMTETVKGRSIAEIHDIFTAFHQLVTTSLLPDDRLDMGKLLIFSNVMMFPMRVKCATLAWHTLKAALTHCPTIVTTEND